MIQRRKGTPQKMIHSETLNDLQRKTNIKLETMLIKREKTRFFKNYVKNILFVRLTAALGHQVLKVHALDINAFLNTLFEMFDDCITRLH